MSSSELVREEVGELQLGGHRILSEYAGVKHTFTEAHLPQPCRLSLETASAERTPSAARATQRRRVRLISAPNHPGTVASRGSARV